jgi:hypothetical protein
MQLLGEYRNGNYTVSIYNDGTKVRETEEDIFIPAFAENCDVKITDKCDGGCPFCYEGCTSDGRHGDILSPKFLDTLKPYTELAINGNDLSHPDLLTFLEILKEKKVVVNMTVNQIHFDKCRELIDVLIDTKLINGLGISLNRINPGFIQAVKQYPNAVIHVINGIVSPSDIEMIADNNLKLLILGYKELRRGADWYVIEHENIVVRQIWLYQNIFRIITRFNVVSFDNLAIEQLNVRRFMSDRQWKEFYMGDDGTMTFYIDLVEKKFAKNSLATIRYDLLDDVVDMFNIIQRENKK